MHSRQEKVGVAVDLIQAPSESQINTNNSFKPPYCMECGFFHTRRSMQIPRIVCVILTINPTKWGQQGISSNSIFVYALLFQNISTSSQTDIELSLNHSQGKTCGIFDDSFRENTYYTDIHKQGCHLLALTRMDSIKTQTKQINTRRETKCSFIKRRGYY